MWDLELINTLIVHLINVSNSSSQCEPNFIECHTLPMGQEPKFKGSVPPPPLTNWGQEKEKGRLFKLLTEIEKCFCIYQHWWIIFVII